MQQGGSAQVCGEEGNVDQSLANGTINAPVSPKKHFPWFYSKFDTNNLDSGDYTTGIAD
jgi:hypothetical protein